MQHSRHSDAPSTPNTWGSQDVRSNLAIQPVASASTLKLKKNAVRIVGPAGPSATRPATSISPAVLPPASGPVKLEAGTTKVPPVSPSIADSSSAPSRKESVKLSESPESMDALFARLNHKGSESTVRGSASISVSRPDKGMFPFEGPSGVVLAKEPTRNDTSKPETSAVANAPLERGIGAQNKNSESIEQGKRLTEEIKRRTQLFMEAKAKNADEARLRMTQADIEHQYMIRASAYIDALQGAVTSTAHLIHIVTKKLSSTYAPDMQTTPENNEIIKARFAFAITKYVNKTLREGQKAYTADSIKQTLKELDGDFLQLCAKLVRDNYVSLETLNDVTGLLKTMLDVLPKAEPIAGAPTMKVDKPTVEANEPNPKDQIDSKNAWPSQEKRENPSHRTCILKGVANVININQLQALVWGGRLESISMPVSGSSNGLVKFITADACEKYHKATANGIEVAGDTKKAVVFVELTEGPNSSNDVVQNCIEAGVTRCVRAIGAHEYTDMMLLKLARGQSQAKKREVDRIKHGKTSRDHTYVEFRFANIYHALSFKRELLDNEDWEHCTITYAPDPCELATGVHYKDDENDTRTGFFG